GRGVVAGGAGAGEAPRGSRRAERVDDSVEVGFEATQAGAVHRVVGADGDDGHVGTQLLRRRDLREEHVPHPRSAGGDTPQPDADVPGEATGDLARPELIAVL